MIRKEYDIHGLLRIGVTGNSEMISQINLHLGAFAVTPELERPLDVIIAPYSDAPDVVRESMADDYSFGEDVYRRPGIRLWMKPVGNQHRYHMDRLAIPINLIVQLALLGRGLTFIHGAAVKWREQGILFPAFPGTGKTTLVTALAALGAKLIGDDLCICRPGEMFPYPQAFSVFPHHLAVLPYHDFSADAAFRRARAINFFRRPFVGRKSRIAKLISFVLAHLSTEYVNVMPEKIFGSDSICNGPVELNSVFVLERSGEINALAEQSVDANEIARQASVVLWHEWHGSFHDLLLYDAMSGGRISVERMFRTVCERLEQTFSGIECHRVLIPAHWDNETLVREMPEYLEGAL